MVFRAKGNTTNKKDAEAALNKIVTDEAQRAVFRDVMRQVAANQASGMTEEARRLRAQKAARGRWEKKDAQKTDN